jgi:hypothetical protein
MTVSGADYPAHDSSRPASRRVAFPAVKPDRSHLDHSARGLVASVKIEDGELARTGLPTCMRCCASTASPGSAN